MAKLRKSVSIRAPIDRVFAYAASTDNITEYWPSVIEVSNVKDHPTGGREYDWTYKMAGVKFHGHTTPTTFEPNRRYAFHNEKGIAGDFTWTFEGENGGTRLTVEVDYQIPGTLLGRLAEPFVLKLNEREADSVLENIKARCELEAAPIGTAAQRPSVH